MAVQDPDHMRLKLRRRLIAARNEQGLTQQALAERLGSNQSFVSAYERGRGIEVVEFLQLTEALGLDPKQVLDELTA